MRFIAVFAVLPSVLSWSGDALPCVCGGRFFAGERVQCVSQYSPVGCVRGDLGTVVFGSANSSRAVVVQWDHHDDYFSCDRFDGHAEHMSIGCGECAVTGNSLFTGECDELMAVASVDQSLLQKFLQASSAQLRQQLLEARDNATEEAVSLAKSQRQVSELQTEGARLETELHSLRASAAANSSAFQAQLLNLSTALQDAKRGESQELSVFACVSVFAGVLALGLCVAIGRARKKSQALREMQVLLVSASPPASEMVQCESAVDCEADISVNRFKANCRFEPKYSVFDYYHEGALLRCLHLEVPGARAPSGQRSVSTEVSLGNVPDRGSTTVTLCVSKTSDIPSGAKAVVPYEIQNHANSAGASGTWRNTFEFDGLWELHQQGRDSDQHGVLQIHLKLQAQSQRRVFRTGSALGNAQTFHVASTAPCSARSYLGDSPREDFMVHLDTPGGSAVSESGQTPRDALLHSPAADGSHRSTSGLAEKGVFKWSTAIPKISMQPVLTNHGRRDAETAMQDA